MILQRLLYAIGSYCSVPSPDDLKIDPVFEEYLKALFISEDEDEFDPEEVSNFLKEHIPEFNAIPSKIFTDWILETRMLLMRKADGELGLSVAGGKPATSPTAYNDSDHLARFFLPKCEVLEEASRVRKTKSTADNDDRPRLTSGERLATMELYGRSSFAKSKPPPHPSEVDGGKLRYLNGEVVNTTGKRYIEIEKEYPNMPKPVYLKAARKYHFH
ncbi:CUE domain containing protein 2 B [Echinococcus multilocularis]|uniref:CUE domain containing protein 2 B n=1 Tax=Echinococcus multilocularis TaxID=6211 RepID=A0A087W046_ECHMU|nr:CUE domain containing protein 2 B [Echinococcus multilocularis]